MAPAFVRDLLEACPGTPLDEVVDALYDLVWAGEVTNDTLQPLRFLGPVRRHPRRPLMRLVPPRAQGRWSIVAPAAGAGTERGIALAQTLLQRHGVLTREAVAAEGVAGGFAALYPVLRAMEESGRVRRGYFVEGCGAAQFALPGAVDALRSQRGAADTTTVLAAVDPANPYGAVLPWPPLAGRAARGAGAYVVSAPGSCASTSSAAGGRCSPPARSATRTSTPSRSVAARVGRLDLQTIDGEPAGVARLAPRLRDAGFAPSPRGLVAYPQRPGRGAREGRCPRVTPSGGQPPTLQRRVGGRERQRRAPAALGRLVGRTLLRVEPVGKHLYMHFSGGVVLHTHMRMTGAWHVYARGTAAPAPGSSHHRRARVRRRPRRALRRTDLRAGARRGRRAAASGPDILGAGFDVGRGHRPGARVGPADHRRGAARPVGVCGDRQHLPLRRAVARARRPARVAGRPR